MLTARPRSHWKVFAAYGASPDVVVMVPYFPGSVERHPPIWGRDGSVGLWFKVNLGVAGAGAGEEARGGRRPMADAAGDWMPAHAVRRC